VVVLPAGVPQVCDLDLEALGQSPLDIIEGHLMLEVLEELLDCLLGLCCLLLLRRLHLLLQLPLLLLFRRKDLQLLLPILLQLLQFFLQRTLVILRELLAFQFLAQLLDLRVELMQLRPLLLQTLIIRLQ
jgi:hypothetical protein